MTAEEYEDGIVQHEDALMLRDVVELHEQLGRAERCVRSLPMRAFTTVIAEGRGWG